jgi:nitrite reductase (NADH) large subunit
MFYVRTADRLQRTSTWRDNLEGGLDYLKAWSSTTSWASPPSWKRDAARGRHLRLRMEEGRHRSRNAQALPPLRQQRPGDDNVVFVEERGQIRPATVAEKKLLDIPVVVETVNIRNQEPGCTAPTNQDWTAVCNWPTSCPTRAWPR